jgi:hypothetical protein
MRRIPLTKFSTLRLGVLHVVPAFGLTSRLHDQRTVSASIHTQIMFKSRINHLAKQKQRGARFSSHVPQNLIEKIAQRYTVDLSPGQVVLQGDFVSISPDKVMTHDNTGAVMQKYAFLGVSVGG